MKIALDLTRLLPDGRITPAEADRLQALAARTAILLINCGFWIGSLWGDSLRLPRGPGLIRARDRCGRDA
ncbi:MAG: hypothetical protein HXY30_11270 [Pseudorhodoplanes sp.]|nr:hypothetical protein [Pseudorhodoplanes sp.]